MKEDKHINELTRELLKGTIECPPPSFTMHVMQLIFQEKMSRKQVGHVRNLPSPLLIITWFIIYVLIISGIFVYAHFNPIDIKELLMQFSNYWVLILTFSLAIPVYIIGVCLEYWLIKKIKS